MNVYGKKEMKVKDDVNITWSMNANWGILFKNLSWIVSSHNENFQKKVFKYFAK